MKTVQDYIDAGILIQSDIDNEYITQENIDNYNNMSDVELKETLDDGIQFMMDDYHTFYYHQKESLLQVSVYICILKEFLHQDILLSMLFLNFLQSLKKH